MSWSTNEEAFCMEAYFGNNLYKVVSDRVSVSFQLKQKAEFLTGFRSLGSKGLYKILIQKV